MSWAIYSSAQSFCHPLPQSEATLQNICITQYTSRHKIAYDDINAFIAYCQFIFKYKINHDEFIDFQNVED